MQTSHTLFIQFGTMTNNETESESVEISNPSSSESALLDDAKNELVDLRSLNYHLLKRVIEIIAKNEKSEIFSANLALFDSDRQNEFYQSLLREVEVLHIEYAQKQNETNDGIFKLNDCVIQCDQRAVCLANSFKNFRRKICKKHCKIKWILQREEDEEAMDAEIEQQRLKNIHFEFEQKKMSKRIKQKDVLSDGLHFIDFEQLKIENQTLNEKIEERNDDLYKLQKKITNTVQILSHSKEKLQFIRKMNAAQAKRMADLDSVIKQKRDALNEKKKKRDLLRAKNQKLKQKQGFIANDALVIDFEQTKNAFAQNQQKLAVYEKKYQVHQE